MSSGRSCLGATTAWERADGRWRLVRDGQPVDSLTCERYWDLPPPVVERARSVLAEFEGVPAASARGARPSAQQQPRQLALFATPENPVLAELRRVKIDTLKPLDALVLLAGWKASLEPQAFREPRSVPMR